MATVLSEKMHAYEAAKAGGPCAVQGGRSRPGRVGPQGAPSRRRRNARPDGDPQALRRQEAAGRRPHHGQPAHDDSDGRAHRDAGRARRRRALGVVQHLLDAGPRRRRGRRRPPGDGRHARRTRRASRSSRGRARRSTSTGGARSKRSCGRTARARRSSWTTAATRRCSCTRPSEFEKAGKVPAFNPDKDPEEWGVILNKLSAELKANPGPLDRDRQGHPRRQRRDDHRRAPAVRDGEEGHADVPGHQRQRLGHQEQVRQHLRLPSLGHRRSEPRHRRHARRQGGRRVRLR